MRIVCVLLLLSLGAFANELKVNASVSASQVFVGDAFQYKVEVRAKEGASVTLPSFVGNLGSFEIRDLKTEERKDSDGFLLTIWSATLNTFVSGDFALAPQEVEVVYQGDTIKTVTDPVAIRVSARTTEADVDILEVEAPLALPGTPWYVIVLVILGVLLFVACIFWIIRKWKRKFVEVQLPPYEEAKLALTLLREKNLAESDQAQYFMELGLIVRRYVQRRFEIEILDATSSELKVRLSHIAGIPEAFKMGMVSFAQETEPVKFAKMNLEKERVSHWEQFVSEWLENTKPVPEEEKTSKNKSK